MMDASSHTVNHLASPACELKFTPGGGVIVEMPKKPLKPEQTKQAVCERLVKLRVALDLKAKDIANRAGLSATQWANYEALSRMPNVEDMVRLADEFGASLDYIYRGIVTGLQHDLAVRIGEIDPSHDMMNERRGKTPVTFGEARAKRA